jgi:DNA-binding NarL/FixJ family response regulator
MPSKSTTTDNQVFIVGMNSLQSRFLANSLTEETGFSCFAIESCAEVRNRCEGLPGGKHVVLYDCMGKDMQTCLEDVDPAFGNRDALLCLFNVSRNTGVEDEAVMKYGIQGFFYVDDPFPLLAKGVRAVWEGEIWVSRHVISRMVQKKLLSRMKGYRKILSDKEEGILTLLAGGATDEEIAEAFYVSKYTLKKWMQKIFRKLNVRGKVQAAVWAAKNLAS